MTQSDQRVAIITGAAGGIGAATAAVLAEAGLAVVLADWQAAPVEQQAQALRDRGYQALGLAADISRRAELEAMSAARPRRSVASMCWSTMRASTRRTRHRF